MPLKRVRVPASKPQGRHFATNKKAKHFAPRSRRVTTAITVAAFALGCVGTVAVRAAAGDDNTANAAGAATKSRPAAAPAKKAAPLGTGVVDPAVKQYMTAQILKAVPAGPGKVAKQVKMILDSPTTVTPALDQDGIPGVALQAYQHAASVLGTSDPSCHLPWQLLAAIGRVESDDGRFGGSQLLANGNTTRPILGIPLDGRPGVALVRDTDGGKLDGDPNFDRAVGPMQFIPSTWEADGVDGNGDGKADPNNIFDAALTAAQYLCKSGGNMTNPAQEAAAVRTYNDADQYVNVVLALATSYEHGQAPTLPIPSGAGGNLGAGSTPSGTEPYSPPWQPEPSQPNIGEPQHGTTPTNTSKGSNPQPATSHSSGGKVSTTKPAPDPSRAKPKPTMHRPKPVNSNPVTKPKPPVNTEPNPASSSAPTSAPTSSAPTSSAPTTSAPTSSAPTDSPTASAPTTTQPTTTAPTTTPTQPTWSRPSGRPTHIGVRPPSHPVIIVKIVNIGWAPAMRQVVIKILTESESTQHQGQAHNGHNPASGTDSGWQGSRSTGDHQNPNQTSGHEPGHGTSGQPGHQPGSNPGQTSGHQTGSEPGHGTGGQPGHQTGTEPGHQTGTGPGNQSGNQQDHQSGDQQTDDQPVGNS